MKTSKNFLQNLISALNIRKEQENFDDIMKSVHDSVSFRGTNLWVLIFAILIASIGLNVNSTAVIIGAMLISPLMWPIIGIGVSTAINDSHLLHRSMKNFSFAIIVSLLTSTLYFLISPISSAHSELLARTSPNIYDVLIAFFGGFVGAIAISSQKKWNVIPGVAIATALMPPLCTVGFGIASMQPKFIFGALYLFFINTVFIAFSAFLVSRLLHFPYKNFLNQDEKRRSLKMMSFVIIITILPSIYFAYDMILQNKFTTEAQKFIENEAKFPENYLLKRRIDAENKKISLVFGGKTITEEQISEVKNRLKWYQLENAELSIEQGFASLYQNPEILEKNSSYKKQIEELSLLIEKKEQEISEIVETKNKNLQNAKQIFSEMQTLFDGVENFIFTENLQVEKNEENTLMAIIFAGKNFDDNQEEKIISWLKKRINSENIEIFFYKNSSKWNEKPEENLEENPENL